MRHINYSTSLLSCLPLYERPAERTSNGLGTNSVELIATIIGGKYQIEIAQSLMLEFGLAGLANASVAELSKIPRLSKARAAALKAAIELGRRMAIGTSSEYYVIRSVDDAAQLLMVEMSHLEQEHFRVLYLNTRHCLLGMETIYIGSLNFSYIRVGEAFRNAVKRNCAAVIFAHNHPSGDPTPSPEDVEATRQLVAAGNLLDIEVLDHLIIGQQRFVSLRERRLGF